MDLKDYLAQPTGVGSTPTPQLSGPTPGETEGSLWNPLNWGAKVNALAGEGISRLSGMEAGQFSQATGQQLPEGQQYPGFSDLVGQAIAPTVGVPGQKPISLGVNLPGPQGLGFSTSGMSPEAKTYAGAVARPIGQSMGAMATDPLALAPFGVLMKFGPAGRALGTMMSAGFAGHMGMQGAAAAKEVWDQVQKEGMTPESVENGVNALIGLGFAGFGAHGAVKHLKANRQDYLNWQKGKTPEGQAAAADQAIQRGEVVGDVQAEFQPLPDDVQARLHTALKGATTLINRNLQKNLAEASKGSVSHAGPGETVPTEAYEIDFNDPMNIEAQKGWKTVPAEGAPETAGFFPGETPREIQYRILDDATIAELTAKSENPAAMEKRLRKATAITDSSTGVVYVGPKGIERILRAKDAGSAIKNAEAVITHEGEHALTGGKKKPTRSFDPMTGEEVTGTERARRDSSGHDMGAEFDSPLDDLSGVVTSNALRDILAKDPTWQKAQGLVDNDGMISENLREAGKDPLSGTYRESTGRLIEEATGRGMGAGDRKLSKSELVSDAHAARVREARAAERKAQQGKIEDFKGAGEGDLQDEARALAEKVKNVPPKDRASALKTILDKYVEAKIISPEHRSKLLQLTRTEVKSPTPNPAAGQADAMIAEAKRLSEQNKVAPAANQAEVDAAHERMAPPPGMPEAKNAPEGTTLRKRSTSEQQKNDREIILDRGNRWQPKPTESRLDVLRRAKEMGLGRPETYEALGVTKSEFGSFVNLMLNNKSTRAGALEILQPNQRGNVATQGAVSTREISLNPRVIREAQAAEAQGRDFDPKNLPKSSTGGMKPSDVSRNLQDVMGQITAEARRRMNVGNAESMRAYADELRGQLKPLSATLHSFLGKLGRTQSADLANRETGIKNWIERLEDGALKVEERQRREAERVEQGVRRSKAENELAALRKKLAATKEERQLKRAAKRAAKEANAPGAGAAAAVEATQPAPEAIKPPPGKPAKPAKGEKGGAVEKITDDFFKEAGAYADEEMPAPVATPPKKRLSERAALALSKKLSEISQMRLLRKSKAGEEIIKEQEKVDRRSIAKRNETIGGRTGTQNVGKGQVKKGKDTILKTTLDRLRGKTKTKAVKVGPTGYTLTKEGTAIINSPAYAEATPAEKRAMLKRKHRIPTRPVSLKTTGQSPAAGEPLPFSETMGTSVENISRGAGVRQDIRPRPQTPDVAGTKVTKVKGTPGVLPRPTSEGHFEKTVPNWDVLPEELRKAYRRAWSASDAEAMEGIKAKGEKLARQVPTSKVSDETLDMARKPVDKEAVIRARKAKEAREAQEKLDMSTVIESALGKGKEGKATTGWRKLLGLKPEPGTPKLTDTEGKPISREGARKPVKKEFIRKMVQAANRADRTSQLARDYEILAAHAKAMAKLEVFEQDAYIEKALKGATQLNRTHIARLRGQEPWKLANVWEEATAAAQALRGTKEQALGQPKSAEQINKERKDFVAKAIKDKLEMYNLLEDQVGANGRLHTGTEETASRKKYKGGFRNLVEDFLDGREIDVDDEYYVHPRDRADMKRKLEAQAIAEFNEELSYNVEQTADVIGVRPSLETTMNVARPLPPQTIARGAKAKGVDVKGRVKPKFFGEADKWLAERDTAELTKRQEKAEKAAKPQAGESYSEFEKERQSQPWRETGEVPLPVAKTGQPGTPASLIRRKGQPPSTDIRSGMAKIGYSKEKFTISEADRAIMDILDREAETWRKEQASAPPRLTPGARPEAAPLPQGMNLRETKVKVRDMIKELAPKGAKGWEEFNKRLLGEGSSRDPKTGKILIDFENEGLVSKLVRKKKLQGGEAAAAFREAARRAFRETQARLTPAREAFDYKAARAEYEARRETPRQRAERLLTGKSERLAPPPGKQPVADFKAAGEMSDLIKEEQRVNERLKNSKLRESERDSLYNQLDMIKSDRLRLSEEKGDKPFPPKSRPSTIIKGKYNPEDFKSAGDADIYEAAGKEERRGIPLSSKHTKLRHATETVEQISGGLKSGITGFDASNPFRQTALLTSRQIATDPKGFARNVVEMVKSYSDTNYQKVDAKLRARPSYKEALKAGLRLSLDPKDHDAFRSSDKLGNFIKHWKEVAKNPANKLTANIVEKGILGAQRAYTHYQNAVMLDAFEAGRKWIQDRGQIIATKGGETVNLKSIKDIGKYQAEGYTVKKKSDWNKQSLKELVDLVNTFASRSEVKNETLARVGNVALFSPQMIKSRLKTFGNFGGWMYETPSVRTFGHGGPTAALGLGSGLMTLAYVGAKLAGQNPEIERNVLSNDFGKLRVGHTTINPWGDYQQYIRVGAQLAAGQHKLRGSGRVQQADRAAIVARMLRGKLSPLAGVATTIFSGADGAGREARSIKGKGRAIGELFVPIMGSDAWNIMHENPNALGATMVVLAALGVGVQASTASRSWIGDYASSQQDVRVTDEIRRLKLEPPRVSSRVPMKGKNAVGQKLYYSLKGDEREEFVNEVMPLISKDIDEFIASKRYQEAPDAVKRRLLFNMIKRENRRYSAAKRLKKDYEGATPVNQWWEEN